MGQKVKYDCKNNHQYKFRAAIEKNLLLKFPPNYNKNGAGHVYERRVAFERKQACRREKEM